MSSTTWVGAAFELAATFTVGGLLFWTLDRMTRRDAVRGLPGDFERKRR